MTNKPKVPNPRPPRKLQKALTPKLMAALKNLNQYCETHLKGKYKIEVIDLLVHPQLAKGDQLFAIPTLVRSAGTYQEYKTRKRS